VHRWVVRYPGKESGKSFVFEFYHNLQSRKISFKTE